MKRWLASRTPTPELDRAFSEAMVAMPEHEEALAWRDDLAATALSWLGQTQNALGDRRLSTSRLTD